MKYTLKKPTYVVRASNKKFVDAVPTVMYRKGERVDGHEYYIVLPKTKGMQRVIKVATNRYIPFDSVVEPEGKSGLILPPTVFAGRMEQEGYAYSYADGGKSDFEGVLPPNSLAIDWADKNTIYYSWFGKNKADKVIELTPDQAKAQHKASGSKKKFGDWVKGSGKAWLAEFGSQLADILQGDKGSGDTGGGRPSDGGAPPPSGKTEILGMHPVTFTLVTVGVIGLIGFLAFGRRGATAKA